MEFTLHLYGNHSRDTWCSVENRGDLLCINVAPNRFKITCLQADVGIPEDEDRSLTEVVLRLDSDECLLRHVFKVPAFGRFDKADKFFILHRICKSRTSNDS